MLTVQTTDGLTDADTYASVDELTAYAAQRGIVLTNDAEQLLVKAMDYIESKEYMGKPLNPKQSTAFPRIGYDIPRNIKKAQLALAVIADTTELMPNVLLTDREIKKEKVDVIEVEYEAAKGIGSAPSFLQPDNLLAPYLLENSIMVNARVYRG